MRNSFGIFCVLAAIGSTACSVDVDPPDLDGVGGTTAGDDSSGPGGSAADDGSGGNAGKGDTNQDPELLDLIEGYPVGEPSPPVDPVAEIESETQEEIRGDSRFTCVYRRYSGTEHIHELTAFDPQADALWPGSLVQGKSLELGMLTPIGLPRAKGTLTMTNVNVSGGSGDQPRLSRTVESPSHATVQEAIQDLLDNPSANLNFGARVAYTMESAHSFEEAAFKLGLNVKWMNGEVKSKFDHSSWGEQTNLVVKLTQSYYTVSFAPPASPTEFFAPSVTAADAARYMGKDNPPLYVSSVVYGRTLLMRVESSASESELRAALEASFEVSAADVETNLDVHHKSVLNSSRFTVFSLGGKASDVLQVASNGATAIPAYLQGGAEFSPSSPGAPISYTLRSLQNNEAVKVALSTDYTIPECGLNVDRFRLTIHRLRVNDSGDLLGKGDNTWEIWYTTPDGQQQFVERQLSTQKLNDKVDRWINYSTEILAPQSEGGEFSVGFWMRDTGSGRKAFTGNMVRFHRYDLAADTWSNIGTHQVAGKDGRLDVFLEYTVEPIQ